jgi:hypothetical protein
MQHPGLVYKWAGSHCGCPPESPVDTEFLENSGKLTSLVKAALTALCEKNCCKNEFSW